jgi:predicted dinucleotide-binding enzyme
MASGVASGTAAQDAAAAGSSSNFDDISIGVIGTGNMASAHAYRWSQYGIKVFIGSRDPAKGQELARRIGKSTSQGGGHLDMIRASNFIIISIYPGKCSRDFFDTYRDEISGKNKMFVDLTVGFSPRFGQPCLKECAPYLDHVNWLKDNLNDPTSSWVKAWANLMARSIKDNRQQPVEVAGDPAAKSVTFRLLNYAGWEPLDCGSCEDIPKIEPGLHSRRWKHPRHLEYNGPNHP